MPEVLGRAEIVKRNIGSIARSLSYIMRGEIVLIPIVTETYERAAQVLSLADGTEGANSVINEVLCETPFTIGEGKEAELAAARGEKLYFYRDR